MTAKAKEPDPVEVHATVEPTPKSAPLPTRPKRKVPEGFCVVDDGTGHYANGVAIPGADICSAHEISHHRDGTPRESNPRGSA